MKKQYWILLFAFILIGDLAGIQLQNKEIQFFFKPLIIPALIGYLDSRLLSITKGLCKWILAALIFSFAGDALLMFEENNSIFFLLGLSSFLLAHIFYIVFFHLVRIKEKIKGNPWLLVVVVIYYAVLINLLSSYLADMKVPVLVYGIVISFMLMMAMHMLFIKNKPAGKWMMIGALMFVISDSLLAINKFYQSFELAGILIMITYGLAQLFIVEGAARYLSSTGKE
jgi:uncharacterized membrane protein YhhN